jgi:hypothetical protein
LQGRKIPSTPERHNEDRFGITFRLVSVALQDALDLQSLDYGNENLAPFQRQKDFPFQGSRG